MSSGRIAALHVYPLKGARPLNVTRADVVIEGLATAGVGDRQWMAVDDAGCFISQRSHARLALIDTALAPGMLTLSADGDGVRIPLNVPPRAPARDVTVWRSKVRGFDEGDEAAHWLSAWVGSSVRLVRFDPAKKRRCNVDFVGRSGAHTRFADGYPLLVIGTASLADLNERLARRGEDPVPMNRFRPNVVIDGLDAFAEDHADTLAIGGITLRPVKPCTRCEVTTIDQHRAVRHDEPLLTLSTYRQHAALRGIAFGMNAIVVSGAGASLALGAQVEVEYRF